MFGIDKNKLKDVVLVLCVVALIVGVAVIVNQDHRITELKIHNKEYERRTEMLEDSLSLRRERISKLEKELSKLPKDNEIIYNHPIKPVTINSDWADIIKSIGESVDTVAR